MDTPQKRIEDALRGIAGVAITRSYDLGRDVASDASEFPLAEINEVLDARTCPLCQHLHGMIVRRDSAEYETYRWPSHINCRRIMVDIHRDEKGPDGKPIQPTFKPPPQELIDKHGHFILNPNKYADLRIPSRPEGRDFIFRRGASGQPGELVWMPGLPEHVRDLVQKQMRDALIASHQTGMIQVGLVPESIQYQELRELVGHLNGLADDWPRVTAHGPIRLHFGELPESGARRVFASWDAPSRTITWQSKYATPDGIRIARESVLEMLAEKDLPPDAGTVPALITHEFGHAVRLTVQPGPLNAWMPERDLRAEQITRYAMTNPNEAFADAFIWAVHTPEGLWNKVIIEFVQLLALKPI